MPGDIVRLADFELSRLLDRACVIVLCGLLVLGKLRRLKLRCVGRVFHFVGEEELALSNTIFQCATRVGHGREAESDLVFTNLPLAFLLRGQCST